MLDDCEKISRLIEPAIDEKDPVEEAYFLCVSSPGLDRPLKKPEDFKRSMGKKVDLKLYSPINNKKEFTGELCGYDENGFTLMIDGGQETFLYKDTAIIRLHVEF